MGKIQTGSMREMGDKNDGSDLLALPCMPGGDMGEGVGSGKYTG